MDLYSKDVLRWATRIRHTEPIDPPFLEVVLRSRVCGSHMAVFADIQNDVIQRLSWDIHLCAVGQAVCGILSRECVGLDRTGFAAVQSSFVALIRGEFMPFPDGFEGFEDLRLLADYPTRHASASLPFECLEVLFEKSAASAAG